ncbi:MAG: glycosyltransferase [Actinobacteria bacterium]|nr:glycosyltransferase [Actinomycetota bacterium]
MHETTSEATCAAEVIAVSRGRESVVAAAALTGESVEMTLGSLASNSWAVLYVRIIAEGDCTVQRVEWSTTAAPAHDVRLSLSITTFNRQQYVVPTVRRVLDLVRASDVLRGRVRVLVVDNASNLDLAVAAGDDLTVVPNRNLGGAGGFARGLMHLRAAKWATHVLFMDDDISLETEALVRTVALFGFGRQRIAHTTQVRQTPQWAASSAVAGCSRVPTAHPSGSVRNAGGRPPSANACRDASATVSASLMVTSISR